MHKILERSVARYFNTYGGEIFFCRGSGPYIYDQSGCEYIDFVLGYGPVVLGHANTDFNRRIVESLESGIHLPGYAPLHEAYILQLLSQVEMTNTLHSAFFKTSSEAVTAAIRVASIVTGRIGVLRCGYCGWHDVQLAKSVSWHLPPNHRHSILHTKGFRGVGDEEPVYNWASLQLHNIEEIIENFGKRISCLIIDAYQLSFMDSSTLQEAISLCRMHNILVIIDETKTSGRVGPLGISSYSEFHWDMLVLGKAIANGAPLSLLLMREEYATHAANARIGGTHSKELLSLQCAMSTLEIMRYHNGYQRLHNISRNIIQSFTNAVTGLNISKLVSLVPIFGGSLVDIRFSNQIYYNRYLMHLLQASMLDNGIVVLVGHPSFLSLAHGEINLDELETKFTASLDVWRSSKEFTEYLTTCNDRTFQE